MIQLESPGLAPLYFDDWGAGWVTGKLDIGSPDIRENVTLRPGVDGTHDVTSLSGPRAVTVNVTAVAGPKSLADLRDQLAPFCVPSRRTTLRHIDPFTSAQRTLTVRAAGGLTQVYETPGKMEYSIGFKTVGSPYWKGRERVTSLALSPDEGAPGIAFPVTFPVSFPDAPPGEDSGLIRNNGTVDATWRAVVEGPATAIRLDNLTHQTSLQLFPIGIGAGEKMILDSYERSVVIGGERRFDVAVLSQFSDWWQLPPGENQLRMVVAGAGSPAQVSFAWADAFYL